MSLDDLIEELRRERAKHGNIRVKISSDPEGNEIRDIDDIVVCGSESDVTELAIYPKH